MPKIQKYSKIKTKCVSKPKTPKIENLLKNKIKKKN